MSFAPVQNLGLVIVDEEHDGSYKQQETPRYHGRDVAIVRARNANAIVVLGSATPSIETRYNADQGRYTMLELPERIAKRPMPQVQVIDMRAEFLETKRQTTFSRALLEEMETRLKNGEQTMLLLNRRGFSSFMVCRQCGERMLCDNCSVVLTLHRRDRRMLCHMCGFAEKIPDACPSAAAIKFNSSAPAQNVLRMSFTSTCPRRASPGSTAIAPARRALSRIFFIRFVPVKSTSWSAPR